MPLSRANSPDCAGGVVPSFCGISCKVLFADSSVFPSTDVGYLLTIWAAAEPAATIVAASIPVLRVLLRAVKDTTLTSRSRTALSTKRSAWFSNQGTDTVTLLNTSSKTVDMELQHPSPAEPRSYAEGGSSQGLGKNIEIVKTVSVSVHDVQNRS